MGSENRPVSIATDGSASTRHTPPATPDKDRPERPKSMAALASLGMSKSSSLTINGRSSTKDARRGRLPVCCPVSHPPSLASPPPAKLPVEMLTIQTSFYHEQTHELNVTAMAIRYPSSSSLNIILNYISGSSSTPPLPVLPAVLDAKDTVSFSTTTTADRMTVVSAGLHQHGFIEGLFSDITVNILGKAYNLHRLALINNRYFSAKMRTDFSDNANTSTGKLELSIDITDPNISHDALKVVFARIYGYFEDRVTTENLKSLLATAYYFHDTDLCVMCADFIKTIKYTPQNALDYITYSSTFDYGQTSLLLLRHVLIYLCRDGASDQALLDYTFPALNFSWFARIVQSDTFVVPSEYNRFQLIASVLQKRLEHAHFSDMKDAVRTMTSHVLALGRLPPADTTNSALAPLLSVGEESGLEVQYRPPLPKGSASTLASSAPTTTSNGNSLHVNPADDFQQQSTPTTPIYNSNTNSVVFLGRPAALASPNLPQEPPQTKQDFTAAAINLISKSILYAHIPLPLYAKIRQENIVPGFVFDRHFRIHHDMIRLVETTPRAIQKLGVAYHYQRKNVVVRDGPPESFFDIVMSPVYAHDLLEMPPFRFAVEFGANPADLIAGNSSKPPTPGGGPVHALGKLLKGTVGESLISKGAPYAGSLFSIKIEKAVGDDGIHALEISLYENRKPGTKEITDCVDNRNEAQFWCRIIAYVHTNSQVTEAYTFESTGVNFLTTSSRIGAINAQLFKELFVAVNGPEGANTCLRLSVLLGVI
ncbi:hypothetical protein HK100_005661 [Physocladia obscura]|uniref:BTB domain-containing protein n=1 Tax=Physocladia obscura TaxID=109957 RepID=A0AAD5SX30_9FUNG|nr:hypothetical protein HK100_005661 [Physocladia obscura]